MANPIEILLKKIDNFQQKHRPIAFPVAVIKKYGDDEGPYLAALIAYYGFLSLFPLFLVTTTVLQLLFKNHEHLRTRVTEGISHYFPVISNHFQSDIHSYHKTGLALIIGILITLYGARGGADALRYAFNKVWRVPKDQWPGFPKSVLNSLTLIFAGGGGLVGAAVLSSYATGLAHGFLLRLIPIAFSFLLLISAFFLIFKIAIAKPHGSKHLLTSAVIAATGVEILQTLGGYLITHELKNLSNLYGTFAVVLGLMFWIYLQVQVLLYAAEAGSVRAMKLWPRSLLK